MDKKILTLKEGWTEPLDFVLKFKDTGLAIQLANKTVELDLVAANGTAVTTTGDVAVTNPAAGAVRYTPDPTDLKAADSPLRGHFKIADDPGGANVTFAPSEYYFIIEVKSALVAAS